MTIQERAEKAADFKSSGACNCCQAVARVFADTVDVSEEDLLKLSAGFAAGMGCMEATCGASGKIPRKVRGCHLQGFERRCYWKSLVRV